MHLQVKITLLHDDRQTKAAIINGMSNASWHEALMKSLPPGTEVNIGEVEEKTKAQQLQSSLEALGVRLDDLQ